MLKESFYFAILFCFCIAIISTEGSSLPIIRNVKDSGDCIAISELLEPGKQAEFKGMKGDETHGTIVYTVQLKSVVNPFGDTSYIANVTLTAMDGKNWVISKVTPLSLDDKQPFNMVYDFERDLNGTYRFTIDVRENNVISLNGKLEIEGYEKDVSQIIASWF